MLTGAAAKTDSGEVWHAEFLSKRFIIDSSERTATLHTTYYN